MKSIQTKSTLSTKVAFLTRQMVYAFLAGLILGGTALGFIDAYAKKPLFSSAQIGGTVGIGGSAVGSIRGQSYGGTSSQEAAVKAASAEAQAAARAAAQAQAAAIKANTKKATTKTSTTKTSTTSSNTKVASTTSSTAPTPVVDEAAKKKALAEIEAAVQTEYNKVYAAELKKGTPDAKAKQIAQAAADQKRAELTALAAATTAASTPKEAAEYVARSYDGVDWEGTLSIKNPSGLNDVSELVTKLINWTLMIIAMVATIVIIISGIMLVFNGGNETTVKKSKTTILWAVVGLVVSISAFAMVNIVQSLL